MRESVVDVSFRTAKRAVAIALTGVAAFTILMMAERAYFQDRLHDAIQEMVQAINTSADIRLADEQLTTSANLAAATGDLKWIERYEASLRTIERALAAAERLAPEEVQQLWLETEKHNTRLTEFERQAFKLVEAGRLEEARALLESSGYAEHKDTLDDSLQRFLTAIIAIMEGRLENAAFQSHLVYLSLLLLVVAGVALLWRQLINGLESSKSMFLESEQQIRRLAMKDSLTGLANRFHFKDRSVEVIQRADNDNQQVALFVIDLDRFKPINDLFGHGVGDEVLVAVAERIEAVTRKADCCARYGGDEFVVVARFDGDTHDLIRQGKRIIKALAEPIIVDDLHVQVGACVGIATTPTHADNYEDLMRKADIALYVAKKDGRGGVCIFDDVMDADIRRRSTLFVNLKAAIDNDQIVPYFQPIVDLETGELDSLEILARWIHPDEGVLSPAHFLQDIVDLDLIDDMTLSLLEKACLAMAGQPSHVSLSLNVAAKQLQNAWMVEQIIAVLEKTGFPPSRLNVEITETALIIDLEQTGRLLARWKERGIRIVIDDFGTGYSSLAYLANLPFDQLKIDQSFIRNMYQNDECMKIVIAILGLGLSLGLDVVGEGIEERWQAELLRRHGCAKGQGFFYSRPRPSEELQVLLAA